MSVAQLVRDARRNRCPQRLTQFRRHGAWSETVAHEGFTAVEDAQGRTYFVCTDDTMAELERRLDELEAFEEREEVDRIFGDLVNPGRVCQGEELAEKAIAALPRAREAVKRLQSEGAL